MEKNAFFLIDTLITKNHIKAKEFIKKNLGDNSEFIFLSNKVPSKCKKCRIKESYLTGINQTLDKKKLVAQYMCPNCDDLIYEYFEIDPYFKNPDENID